MTPRNAAHVPPAAGLRALWSCALLGLSACGPASTPAADDGDVGPVNAPLSTGSDATGGLQRAPIERVPPGPTAPSSGFAPGVTAPDAGAASGSEVAASGPAATEGAARRVTLGDEAVLDALARRALTAYRARDAAALAAIGPPGASSKLVFLAPGSEQHEALFGDASWYMRAVRAWGGQILGIERGLDAAWAIFGETPPVRHAVELHLIEGRWRFYHLRQLPAPDRRGLTLIPELASGAAHATASGPAPSVPEPLLPPPWLGPGERIPSGAPATVTEQAPRGPTSPSGAPPVEQP